ncbi:MBL fold metallo-hydrolase [Thermasporomyces composti]|uniref:Cyclase n=1 Tax=Thermasporomyces composti TaxID=696763 RepID=A0A3D9VGP9_THECX|nr:MBL fold metallo-hydrolase [Thermasporomyces composti]REF38325.1 cyclase [Thermasporomyces composti]
MPAPPAVRHLSSRVVAYLQAPGGWFLNNAGWVTGVKQTFLIDTCATEKRTRQLLEAVRADTDATNLDPVVITHAHGDHANGAGLLARAGSTVMATEAATREIMAGPHLYPEVFAYDGWGDVRPPATITTITERVSFDLGDGRALELVPVPTHAHTPGDLVVWLPEERVLFAGDLLFVGVTPLAVHGSIRGWLDALEWLAGFDAIHLVPGHGPVCTGDRKVIADVQAYLRWLLDVTADDCPDFDALHEQASDRWSAWLDPERHVVNLRVAHAEVHGQPFDLAEALQALLRVNGGPIVLDL